MKQIVNLVNGIISRKGPSFEVLSPINQDVVAEGGLLSREEVVEVFQESLSKDKSSILLKDVERIGKYIEEKKQEFVEQIILETGYALQDSQGIVNQSIEFVTYFSQHLDDTSEVFPESRFSYSSAITRKLKLFSKPYGVIAAMTPQNVPLILELVVILNALAAGNSVILRPSSQCVGTVGLLIEALVSTLPYDLLAHVSIISCKAVEFLEVSYNKANLIHYIGSSSHGRKVLNDSLLYNLKAVIDGEGNSKVVIDETANLDQAVKACRDGIIRSNGELCSTVRTIVVADKQYDNFCAGLVRELDSIKIGDPRVHGVDMGPLFHVKQAEALRDTAKKYSLISGSLDSLPQGDNYLTPLLCQLDPKAVGFLKEEVFGPIAGVVPYSGDDWKKWLTESNYRLSDAVFSNNNNFIKEFIATSRSPRIIVNNDPSTESVFEPWGGFLPNGSDEVSFWRHKYSKVVQLDTNV